MIRRGTTPTHTFTLPCDSSVIKEVMIIYAQNDAEVICKTKDHCKIEGNTVTVTLTQSDTLKFNHRYNVQVQVRILTLDGVAAASDIEVVSVRKLLNDEVME